MNTVIVNNKPRPVVPSPLVVGRTQSVFNVFGYSLWNNDVLDKEIAQAQERHAKEIEKYKEKRQAWDELTAMEYHVLLDTNAVIESAKLSDGTVIDFEYIIETCTRFGFKLAITKTAACEIKHQTKKKIGENFTKEKHAAAVKAVNMIVSGEILSVGFDRSRFSEEGFNSLDCYKNETIAEMRKRGFNCYAKALETINAEKFEFRFYGFLNDALIEDEAVAFAKRGNNVVFISNDGQVGGRGEMFFCEENKKFTSPCLREYVIFVNSINNKRSKIV